MIHLLRRKIFNMKSIKKYWQLYLIVAIPTVYLLVFRYIPMLGNVIAFRTYLPGGSVFGQDWVGLRYFQMFIGDATFWKFFLTHFLLGFGHWFLLSPYLLSSLFYWMKLKTGSLKNSFKQPLIFPIFYQLSLLREWF